MKLGARAHNAVVRFPGMPLDRVRGTKNHHAEYSRGRGEVRRARIVSHEEPRTRDEGNQFAQIERRRDHRAILHLAMDLGGHLPSSRSPMFTTLAIPCSSRSQRAISAYFRDGPAHGVQSSSRLQDGIGGAGFQSFFSQLLGHGVNRILLGENLGIGNGTTRQAREIKLRHAMFHGVHHWLPVEFGRVGYIGREHCTKRETETLSSRLAPAIPMRR